jgi:hypothetical protein
VALGGLLLGAGFGVYADRTLEEDGYRSTRVITGITLAVLAVIGAAVAVLFCRQRTTRTGRSARWMTL